MHALLKSTCEIPLPIEHSLKLAEDINPVLSHEVRQRLRYMHMQSFDQKQGGLLSPIKFIDRDSTEYSLILAAEQDRNEERNARLTLDNAIALLDPVWGGIYQYSTQSRWNVPHYRKTIAAQAGHMRLYSLAYAQLKYCRYQSVADSIQAYIKNFMCSESGAFYSGQADGIAGMDAMLFFSLSDKRRKAIGIPEIDKRVLSRENGWMIEALATHFEYCGNKQTLIMAIDAAEWINQYCRNDAGGYLTNRMVSQPIHLADTLSMARALLQLYRATFDKKYLELACHSTEFMKQHFSNAICGYNSRILSKNETTPPRQIDENIALTRFVNLLSYYSHDEQFIKMAKHGLRYLCIPEVATARMEEAGILIIDRELSSRPLSIIINGERHDPVVQEFVNIAYHHEGWYKLIIRQPAKTASALIEIDNIKSKPVITPMQLKQLLDND